RGHPQVTEGETHGRLTSDAYRRGTRMSGRALADGAERRARRRAPDPHSYLSRECAQQGEADGCRAEQTGETPKIIERDVLWILFRVSKNGDRHSVLLSQSPFFETM